MGVRVCFLSFALAGLAFAGVACSTGPKPQPAPAEPRRVEPPATLSSWDQLSWLERQMDSLPAGSSDERANMKVRAAELFISVNRADKAGVSARESLFIVGESGSVASRAHAVLGAAALLRGDAPTAKKELELAASTAKSDSDVNTANGLLALAAERRGSASEASGARARVRNAFDPRLTELAAAVNAAAPVTKPVVVATQTARADANKPVIIPRQEWNPAPIGKNVDPMGPISRITVHHEAAVYYGTSKGEGLKKVRDIQSYHQHDRGYADIAYHFIIDRVGNVFEGRPLSLQGAHAGEKNKRGEVPNAGNIGISLLGDYEKKQTPSSAQEKALRELVQYLQAAYNIPQQNVFTHAEIRNMFDLRGTACPGCNLAPLVIDIRKHGAFGGARPEAAARRTSAAR